MEIINRKEENKFELRLSGNMAQIDYIISGPNIILYNTRIIKEASGVKNFVRMMIQKILDVCKELNYIPDLHCPFLRAMNNSRK